MACGELEGNPYFIRLNKSRSLLIDFKADKPGLFSAAIADTSDYLAIGTASPDSSGTGATGLFFVSFDKTGN